VANETVARRYATAVFELAKKSNAVAKIGSDLRLIWTTIYGSENVRRFYLSPVFDRTQKEALLAQAFGASVDVTALHTLLLLVRKRREALLASIVTEYDKLALAAAGKEPLEIVSARDLSSGDLAEMLARLEATYGKSFELTSRTDPGLLGGVRITMGDRRIDGSLSGRIDDIARELFTRN
jgi:F-type H+-transporting ATPase subunit delta